MKRTSEQVEPLELLNPNRVWVLEELNKLYEEWMRWQVEVSGIVDQPYDRSTQSEVFCDGQDMMEHHEILQAKTLTFLNSNIAGHGFITGFDGQGIDRRDLRLAIRVMHRITQLRILMASLEYARVPEGWWKERAKDLIAKLANKSGDAAIEVAKSYLKNPGGEGG